MGKGAPPADPNIGVAAMMSAKTGQDYLAFMKGQSDVANKWATEDRARYKSTFQPLEDKFVADAQTWDSPEAQDAAARAAAADVAQATAAAGETQKRQAMAMGVNPNSGRFMDAAAKVATSGALATAGANNLARRQIRLEGEAKRADAINLGKGMAVNPGTSLGMASGAASSGFSGAMQGYSQQGQLLAEQQRQRMDAWQANQGMLGGLGSAIGSIAGAFMSSEDLKTNKKPARNLLKVVKSLPVEKWDYKPGVEDGGTHIGPYAGDFQKATGLGDGRMIKVVDAVGVTMGAVKEMATKLDRIERKIKLAA